MKWCCHARIGPMRCKYGIYHADYRCDCGDKRARLEKALADFKALIRNS